MRVLYLCHRIPYPPDKGDKIRAFHQLRAMGARHEVDVFTLADHKGDLAYRDPLAAHCRRLTVARVHPRIARIRALPFLLTNTPLTVPYFYSAELRRAVDEALASGSYDRIFVYCSAMAQYVKSTQSIPMVMDLVDVDSDKWTQYAAYSGFPLSNVYRREGRTLQAYERSACERAACVLVSTEREAQLTRRIAPGSRVQVIPNGVDADYFKPAPQAYREPAVIFTGDMSYFPNEEAVIYFACQVLPLIRREVTGARFLIVGRNPGRKVQALADLEGVEVTGFVPDVRTWLAKARVAVAPFMIAAGIQNKILEAMSFGLPVVATSRATQGLSPSVAGMVEVGDTPNELASKISILLKDSQLALSRGLDGRRCVTEAYRWDDVLEQLLRLMEESAPLVGTPSSRT